jgi:hypothetical protein
VVSVAAASVLLIGADGKFAGREGPRYNVLVMTNAPDLNEVRAFARHLHSAGKRWTGELLGWPAAYTPESRRRPAGSKRRFTPADFWIGESGIWFFSLMWERGKANEPAEFLDDRGIVKE